MQRKGAIPNRNELLELPGIVQGEIRLPLIPQQPTLVDKPANGGGWLHELKLDGYRLILWRHESEVKIFTRNGHDWTRKLQVIANALTDLPIDDVVLDGELVAVDDEGKISFNILQNSMNKESFRLHFYAFDLLQIMRLDIRKVPVIDRKAILRRIIPTKFKRRVLYWDHVTAPGQQVFTEACRLGAEGIVSKRADAPYSSGRSLDWLKVKCVNREAFFVGGFSVSQQNPLVALLLGRWDEDKLIYVGRVGSGFHDSDVDNLAVLLEKLVRTETPFYGLQPSLHRGEINYWVEPRLAVETQFTAWTSGGRIRHASYKGIREDLIH